MVYASEADIEANPTQWLAYYQSLMSFYNSQASLWKSIAEFLENEYKANVDDYVDTAADNGMAVSKAEAKARNVFSNLKRASTMATAKSRYWYGNFSAAEGRRDVVSRSVTARESDRKVQRW